MRATVPVTGAVPLCCCLEWGASPGLVANPTAPLVPITSLCYSTAGVGPHAWTQYGEPHASRRCYNISQLNDRGLLLQICRSI